jgi:hypothetical protein
MRPCATEDMISSAATAPIAPWTAAPGGPERGPGRGGSAGAAEFGEALKQTEDLVSDALGCHENGKCGFIE